MRTFSFVWFIPDTNERLQKRRHLSRTNETDSADGNRCVLEKSLWCVRSVYDVDQRVEEQMRVLMHVGAELNGYFAYGPYSVVAYGYVFVIHIRTQYLHKIVFNLKNRLKKKKIKFYKIKSKSKLFSVQKLCVFV